MGLFDTLATLASTRNNARVADTSPKQVNAVNTSNTPNTSNTVNTANTNTPNVTMYNGAFAPLLEQFGIGRKHALVNQTAQVLIQPEEFYRGIGYGVIRKAINTGIVTAEENIRTTCSTAQREMLAKKGDQIEHPYITLYRNSPYFSEYDFWKWYLLYIQLKGEFYIYVDRKPIAGNERYRAKNLMTFPKYMRIINPYEMTVNYDNDGNVKSYTQNVKRGTANLTRDFQPYQIIHVSEINPFDTAKPYSILDATAENFFTLKNAQDFTRHAVVNNTNSPMIVSTGEFETEEGFENFVSRVLTHEDGEPIVTSGSGEVKVQELSQNLDGASLEKINMLNRDEIFIASGASKSILGVETTGLTRDVAATQKLTYVESTVVPMIKLLIETLNYDYRTMYPLSFAVDKYIMHITNPSTGDKTQELKELEVREQEYTLVEKYVARGYTRKSAAQFVRGEIDVEQLQLEDQKARLTPQESTELVDSVERWQELIAAGNDPESVIALMEGRISLGEFLLKNKDVTPPAKDEPSSEGDKGDDSDNPDNPDNPTKPKDDGGSYYDPDDDYSTPRDMKDPKSKKKKKPAKSPAQKNYIDALNILSTFDCKITEAVATPLIDPMLSKKDFKDVIAKILKKAEELYNTAKEQNLEQILNQLQEKLGIRVNSVDELQKKLNLSSKDILQIQSDINRLNYAKINAKLREVRDE